MSQTFEITFVEEDLLEDLADNHDDERIASIMFREDRPTVSLGRAWHMIHALLTGTRNRAPGPLSFILGGGRMIGEQDANGGWVCAYSASQVAKIQAALPSEAALAERYATDGLPDGIAWSSQLDSPSGAEYFLEPYRELLEAMKQAVADERGMLAGLI